MSNCKNPIPMNYREYSVPGGSCASSANHFCNNDFPIAMAYVPWQHFGKTYPIKEALGHGTLFPELYKPLVCNMGGTNYGCK